VRPKVCLNFSFRKKRVRLPPPRVPLPIGREDTVFHSWGERGQGRGLFLRDLSLGGTKGFFDRGEPLLIGKCPGKKKNLSRRRKKAVLPSKTPHSCDRGFRVGKKGECLFVFRGKEKLGSLFYREAKLTGANSPPRSVGGVH